MTDKEIIQALRRCQFGAPCARCPAVSYKNCMDEMHKCAADLIERLTAENVILPDGQASAIESLRKEIEWKDMVIALAQRKQAEAEAREIEETLSGCDYSISRMVELMKADVEGRVLILPCKVGDTVWRIKRTFEEYPDKSKPYIEPDAFLLQDVFNIGKTVFLTHEEAEKALEARKDG